MGCTVRSARVLGPAMTARLRSRLTLFALLLAGCGAPPETLENRYERANSPEAQNARSRGVIPAWVPEAATELIEAHDPVSRDSLLIFRSPTVLIIPHACDVTDQDGVVRPTLTKPWWPSDEVLGGSRVMFYRCPFLEGEPRMFIALASGEPWVYVWSTLDRRPR